jgi:hypothetical protein
MKKDKKEKELPELFKKELKCWKELKYGDILTIPPGIETKLIQALGAKLSGFRASILMLSEEQGKINDDLMTMVREIFPELKEHDFAVNWSTLKVKVFGKVKEV